MKAITFIIGSEILDGKTIDTNSISLFNYCLSYGIKIEKKVILPDNKSVISKNIKNEINYYDLFFILGGLGPTFDDVTIDSVAEALNLKASSDKNQEEKILNLLNSRNIYNQELVKLNLRQARYIGQSLKNDLGYSVGSYFIFDNKGVKKHFFLLPGPKNEFEKMMKSELSSILEKLRKQKIFQKNLYVYNISESKLNKILTDLSLQTFSGIYTKDYIKILTFESSKHEDIISDIKKISDHELVLGFYINEINNKFIFFDRNVDKKNFSTDNDLIITDDIEFGKIFFDFLSHKNLSFSSAESISGGLLSHIFTSFANASKYFQGSVVCYSNYSKINILNIKEEFLNKYGPVSSEITSLLSKNTRKLFQSDFSIAITGYAGPYLGYEKYPIGTCFISITLNSSEKKLPIHNEITEIYNLQLKGNRNTIQNLSVIFAMFLAIYHLYD